MSAILLTALALAQAAPLPATPPEHFYNRPGASGATRDADLARCRAITTGPMAEPGLAVVKDRRLTPPVGPAPDLPPAIAPTDNTLEVCMSERGWRLYALSARERRTWARLSPSARARLNEALTGAQTPRWGQLLRPASGIRLTPR